MTNPTALKAIAEAATQDDWEADGCEVLTRLDGDVDGDTGRHFVVGGDLIAMTADTADAEANATFIATFDPPTVLALLSEIEEKDRRIEALVKALEAADQDLFQLHDWIAEETDHTDRIMAASEMVKRVRSTLTPMANDHDRRGVGEMLKPCPFCGSPGYSGRHEESDAAWQSFMAGCSDDDCIASSVAFDFVSEETAIAAWNTRALPASPTLEES